MIIPVIKKYSRWAALAVVGIVVLAAMFGGDDEEMMYFHVNGQTIAVPVSGEAAGGYQSTYPNSGTPWNYYGQQQQVSPNAYYDMQGNYEYNTRFGGGSRYTDGSWNHYSPLAGGAVGGTSDGCVYTSVAGGWSNC